MKWIDVPKIDTHVHIVPQEVHDANPDSDDEFSFAIASDYAELMDRCNIKKAIIMPLNDPWVMSMDFTVDAVHRNLLDICKADGRFNCFADVDTRNTPEETCESIRKAFASSEYCGIKLHPNNSGMNIDDAYNDIIAEYAVKHGCPVAIHSYPAASREQDRDECCAPVRIRNLMERHPGLKVIVCHLGGFQWEDAVGLDAFFDISAVLPDFVNRYGIKETNKILRKFGVHRLLYATDWPCSRSVKPEGIMKRYLDILDQMDFSENEMHRIGHENAEDLFGF